MEKIVKNDLELPTVPEEPTRTVPSTMILFGLPKCGKTTKLSELPNCLNIDVERGSNFVRTLKLQPPLDLGPVSTFNWLKKVIQKIKDEGRPYDFVAIDTISYLDQLSEWVGTWNYCQTPQGKSFNRIDSKKGGVLLLPDHPDYESVHTLPDGAGYRYSRSVMTDIFDRCVGLGKICTIFVCHTVDKYVVSKQTNTEVRTIDLSLTGKVRNIYSRDVDAIGYVFQKDEKLNISFKGDENRVGGMRGNKSLQGYEGPLDWKMIFDLK